VTSFIPYASRTRDIQDYVERGVWGSLVYIPGAGASMAVRGTGTLDEEVPLLNLGYGFNLPANSDAEMVMLSLGSDVNDKVVIATIPRGLQHQWGEGQGGVQHPTDPARRIEFNADETLLTDGNYVFGPNRSIRLDLVGDDATINLAGGGTINITTDGEITVGGNISITVAGNATVAVGGSASITAGGALTIAAPSVEITSGTLRHNGVNVGNTHTHGGVNVGGSNTGGPS